MKNITKKKNMPILFSLILIIILCIGCSGKKVPSMLEMSKKDKEFDSYARKAAQDMVEQEINDVTWATVETGDLEYMYTLYNKDAGLYEVQYITKFDESNDPADQWIVISIILTEQKHVSDATCAYMGTSSYEATYGQNVTSRDNPSTGEKWVNINNLEEGNK